jgi:hypothetical protein
MNTESTAYCDVKLEIIGYSDGVYNLAITSPNEATTEKIAVSEAQAQTLCDALNVECPDPEPTPPEQWGDSDAK